MNSNKEAPFLRERKRLGESIKVWRNKRNLSQEALAEKAKVNASYLAKIENGYVNVTLRYLIKLSRALGVAVRDLFDF